MATARTRKKPEKNEFNLHIKNVQFRVQRDLQKAFAQIDYEKVSTENNDVSNTVEVRLPVISLWVDPDNNTAIKAHLQAPNRPQWNKMARHLFWRDLRKVEVPYYNRLSFTADTGGIIRYGARDIRSYSGSYGITYHDSKGVLLRSIFDFMGTRLMIGGISLIDVGKIDDSVLTEMGFTEIPDVMGRLPSMWEGNIRDLFSSGRARYQSENQQKNMESFIDMVSRLLENVKES